jgi:ADP-heptose:LPS heptosyltransferase
MTAVRSIVIYRCGSLGDTIVALPAIQAVRAAHPQAALTLMTASDESGILWADRVLREFGWFAGFVTYRPPELRSPLGLARVLGRVRRVRPDLVVHLGSDRNSRWRIWRDACFFRLAGARRVVAAPASAKVGLLGRLRRDPGPYPSEVTRLVAAVRGAGLGNGAVRFDVPQRPADAAHVTALLAAHGVGGGRPLVALCPGSKQPSKRWPIERWAAVGARLIAEGHDVVIVGGGDEAAVAATVTRGWPAGRFAVLAGQTSVLQSAALLRRCRLYVGNDTGAMHVAAAVGTPCIAVFAAREAAASWHPYGPGHVVLRRDDVPCANCHLSECTTEGLRCLTAISIDDVWAACHHMLAAA